MRGTHIVTSTADSDGLDEVYTVSKLARFEERTEEKGDQI
jgi:hypothetical protein